MAGTLISFRLSDDWESEITANYLKDNESLSLFVKRALGEYIGKLTPAKTGDDSLMTDDDRVIISNLVAKVQELDERLKK
jgi:hypothetical protein